ncbi:alkene reductase [Paucibacter sp. TC2R-5]|uniref:alkene reductase n=1 Tax=Paucibacter sp. TC2R-5 TaxID=2893555 RepID=UPI0021E4963C|nr:alkene reductase [Paucibacter sp. TC2R-5]MCV2358400.1 alkene reductase [Paucibacter sp. TC2R-5]
MPSLFDPIQIGDLSLTNRIVMAPLTRSRAPGLVPNDLMVEYYRQRASAGLIISEGTQICEQGQGYFDTPGIHTPEQVAGWHRITDAVHAAGGKIAAQLWHVGRVSHCDFQPGGAAPVSSTARAASGNSRTPTGLKPLSTPRALSTAEVGGVVQQFAHAARCAMDAGFDAVEVHGANSYLIDQFLHDSINDRVDAYGGSIANRARFVVEVMTAVAGAIGAGRSGLRLSPVNLASTPAGCDSQVQALYNHVAERLAPLGLAFLHVVEGQTGGPRDATPFDYAAMRERFGGPWIVNNGYSREMALKAVAEGRADMVAFGRDFISNPDLVRRLRLNAELQPLERTTLYGGGPAGYTDYPIL